MSGYPNVNEADRIALAHELVHAAVPEHTEVPAAGTVEMKLEVVVPPASDVDPRLPGR